MNVSSPSRRLRCLSRALLLALAALLPLLSAARATAQANPYADYPKKRGEIQAFHWNKIPTWMTLDMQWRDRVEGISAFGDVTNDDRIYDLTRVFGGMQLRPSRHFDLYMQFLDVHAPGLPLHATSSTMRDNFDLHQGYLRFHVPNAALYAGRKELKFGDERVVGVSDFTNTARVFDGFYGNFGTVNTLDLFSASVVTVYPTSLDKHGAGLRYHGAWANLKTLAPHMSVQPFVLIKAQPRVLSRQHIYGSELETTFGAEVTGNTFRNLDYDLLGDLQRGSYANDSIHAGAGIAKLAYRVPALPWAPRFGGEWDFASGDAHRLPRTVSTYDQQYPSNHNAFGLQDFFGFQNITQSRVNIDLIPNRRLSFLIQQEFLHVSTPRDAVYTSSGGILVKAPTGGFAGTYIGRGFDASSKYLITDALVMNTGIDYFTPGPLLVESRHGASPVYAYLSLTYRFQILH